MIDEPGHLPGAFGLNYPEFPDSCLRRQLPFVIDVHEVLVNGLHRDLEQVGDEPLREPNGLAVQADLDGQSAGVVNQQLPVGGTGTSSSAIECPPVESARRYPAMSPATLASASWVTGKATRVRLPAAALSACQRVRVARVVPLSVTS